MQMYLNTLKLWKFNLLTNQTEPSLSSSIRGKIYNYRSAIDLQFIVSTHHSHLLLEAIEKETNYTDPLESYQLTIEKLLRYDRINKNIHRFL